MKSARISVYLLGVFLVACGLTSLAVDAVWPLIRGGCTTDGAQMQVDLAQMHHLVEASIQTHLGGKVSPEATLTPICNAGHDKAIYLFLVLAAAVVYILWGLALKIPRLRTSASLVNVSVLWLCACALVSATVQPTLIGQLLLQLIVLYQIGQAFWQDPGLKASAAKVN